MKAGSPIPAAAILAFLLAACSSSSAGGEEDGGGLDAGGSGGSGGIPYYETGGSGGSWSTGGSGIEIDASVGAVCGNGVVEDGEVCDDGNLDDDVGGCLADCSGPVVFTDCDDAASDDEICGCFFDMEIRMRISDTCKHCLCEQDPVAAVSLTQADWDFVLCVVDNDCLSLPQPFLAGCTTTNCPYNGESFDQLLSALSSIMPPCIENDSCNF